jgi:2-polyprenyl-3-methyl-5-hydroxy-6-metoxy-1,4-benzoquinol methylase
LPILKEKKTPNILISGCGNSKFSEDLYSEGYVNITNIDFSEEVIIRM